MKILCVIDILGSGGAQRQLVNLAIGFKEQGHSVSFLVYHHHNFYLDVLNQNNIPVHEIIEPNYFKRLLKMRRFIRKGKYDAVLSFLQAANFICEIAGLPHRKWKLVVGERSANPAILKSFKLKAYRWFHLLADHVVANSHENIKMVRKINPLLSKQNFHVIYNTIDFEKWKPDAGYTSYKNRKFKMVIAASHRYLKNLNGLVEAVNRLSEVEKQKLSIDWYGSDGYDQSKVDALKKIELYKLTHIFHFYEPTPLIHEKVQQADAVGLFSHHEGLPNTVCEGMAMGKPVIASNVSDVPLLIKNKKFIFDPKSPNEIAHTLSELLNATEKELGKAGEENRKNAVKLFNNDRIIETYLKLLEND